MADTYNIILDILAVTVAGVAAWAILASTSNSSRWVPFSSVTSRLQMPPDQKELLREWLISQSLEGCGGSWSSQWDQPTGDRQ